MKQARVFITLRPVPSVYLGEEEVDAVEYVIENRTDTHGLWVTPIGYYHEFNIYLKEIPKFLREVPADIADKYRKLHEEGLKFDRAWNPQWKAEDKPTVLKQAYAVVRQQQEEARRREDGTGGGHTHGSEHTHWEGGLGPNWGLD